MSTDELDRRGAAWLAELADDPSSECWRQFDALYYEIVWRFLRANHAKLGMRVARYLRVEGAVAPALLSGEVDEVAHEATKLALRRVRENAARFDPARGRATMWVLGAAQYAFIEVAKTIASARRSATLVYVPPESLEDEPDRDPTPEEAVLRRLEDAECLEEAASHLTEREFAAVRLIVTAGYSYAEAAEAIFGDRAMTKKVDGLLTRGKQKLAAAWADRRPSPGKAGSSTLADRTDG